MKEKIPEELRKEFEQAVLNADLDHWMVDNDRQFLDKIWDAVDKLFNQEVEKQIAERMPSEDDGRDRIPYPDKPTELKHYQNIGFIRGWRAAIKECRSRLSQKTEG